MLEVNKLILDVLKPYEPDVLEFSRNLASQGENYHVSITVIEMDDKTETLEVIIEGPDLQLDKLVDAINKMGASLHSVDGVEVTNHS